MTLRGKWLAPWGVALCCLLAAGCASVAPPPERTRLPSAGVVVPATLISNCLVVETQWDKAGPWHFLIDTGSSVTLVSAEFAKRYQSGKAPVAPPQVRVKSAGGGNALLPATTLKRLPLGGAVFEGVPALVYDFSDLSSHLGLKIDGILGFPLFRDTLLTLDYPNSRLVISPRLPGLALHGAMIPFNNENNTPLIPIRMGDTTFIALIDSGSDTALSLNPVGLNPPFACNPRPGPAIATLTGDRPQRMGRLAVPITIGPYPVSNPLVDLTDDLSSIGGEILKNFTVTFDQKKNQASFHRDTTAPVVLEPRRSSGLGFSRMPAYWRVESVIPDSPAASRSIQPGDLCTKINGDPVAHWDFHRYAALVHDAAEITYTFLNGTREHDVPVPVFDLVP